MKLLWIALLVVSVALPVPLRAQNAYVPLDSQSMTSDVPCALPGRYVHTRDQLDVLPSRQVADYLRIWPGATMLDGTVHVRGGRPVETDFRIEGISVRRIMGAGDTDLVIPEALSALELQVGGCGAGTGGANAGVIGQRLRSGGERLAASAAYELDAATEWVDAGYSYDAYDLVATLGGPLWTNQLHVFGALDYRRTTNYWPIYWSAVDLGRPTQVTLSGDPIATAPAEIAWDEGELPGAGRPQERLRINATADVDLGALQLRALLAMRDETRRINAAPALSIFNAARVPARDDETRLASLRGSYDIADKLRLRGGISYFADAWRVYDPLLGAPEADGAGGAAIDLLSYYDREAVRDALDDDGERAEYYTSRWQGRYDPPYSYRFIGFSFDAPGSVMTAFRQREQRRGRAYLEVSGQVKDHALTVGGEYARWRVRDYVADGSALASAVQWQFGRREIASGSEEVARRLFGLGYGGLGYDAFLNEVDDGPDAARAPSTASLYVENHVGVGRFRVRAGLRLERFDTDLRAPDDPAAFDYDWGTGRISGLRDVDARYVLQPRMGVETAVAGAAVHVRAGRYAQMPDMANAYRSSAFIGRIALAGMQFVNDAFAWDLDPLTTDQLDLRVTRRVAGWAMVDLAAYARTTRHQVRVARQDVDLSNLPAPYHYYESGGESRVLGVEVTAATRAWRNTGLMATYSYTDARGTESEPNEPRVVLSNGQALDGDLHPLSYAYRHWVTVLVNHQTGDAPAPWAAHWTGGLLLTLHSGHPYTRGRGTLGGSRTAGDGMILSERDPRANQYLEPTGSSSTPWVFNVDLRIEKGIDVGPAIATAFVYVQNVLNARRVQHVYGWTGEADDDGFLGEDSPYGEIQSAFGPDFQRFYEALNLQNRQHILYDRGYDLYGAPRSVRLGLRLEL